MNFSAKNLSLLSLLARFVVRVLTIASVLGLCWGIFRCIINGYFGMGYSVNAAGVVFASIKTTLGAGALFALSFFPAILCVFLVSKNSAQSILAVRRAFLFFIAGTIGLFGFLYFASQKVDRPFFCADPQALRAFLWRALTTSVESVGIVYPFILSAVFLGLFSMLSWLVLGRKKPTTPFVADQRSKKVLFFEILILLLIFCGSFGAKAMVSALPAPSQMNVLLISIDTLRADALGCYSPNSPSYTPNIDTLAGRGLRFANAYANSPWTLPSHGAMMASALPTHLALSSVSDKLAESNLTLAEHFLENGYNTFAVVNHLFVAPAYGFGQGFSDFQTIPESKSAAPVATGALAQMKQAERPWFGFVHFFTPHWPYGNQAPPIDYYQFLQQAQRFSSEEIQNLKSAYLQEVWAVDIQIGRIVAFLKQSGQLERTVVLITSDHGEAFGEKGVFGHGYFLDEPALRIPWILVDPKRPAARVSEMTVDLLDVAPTLAALAKTGSAPSFQGRDLSSLFDDRSPQQKPVFAQTSLSQDPATAVVFDQKKFITPIVASYKDLRFERSAALFDLSTDPTEDQNLLERKPEVVSRLMKLIQKAEGDSPADAKPAFLTKQETERLKTLGYLP